MTDHRLTPGKPGYGGRRGGRRAIPDTPLVAVVTVVVTLALAVVLFLTAMPGEERVLVFEGREVAASDLCETADSGGATVERACVEVAEYQTRSTGWSVVPLVVAGVLAAAAAIVVAGIPRQVGDRRREEAARIAGLTEDDFKGHL